MKVKTSDLIGTALDLALAKCEDFSIEFEEKDGGRFWINRTNHTQQYYPPFGYLHDVFFPSSDWSQGGPIIDEMMKGEFFFMENDGNDNCHVAYSTTAHNNFHGYGPTPLVAAMRCFVASKLGDEVDIPDELCK